MPVRLHRLRSDRDPVRSRRAMQAMLRMRKWNIAERADGTPVRGRDRAVAFEGHLARMGFRNTQPY